MMLEQASLFHYLSFGWAVLSLVLLMIAWKAAKKRNIVLHRNLMILMTIAAWVFILSYLYRYKASNYYPTVPESYQLWFMFHGCVGLIPFLGATTLVISRLRQKGRFLLPADNKQMTIFQRHHKMLGRYIIILWAFSHVGGMINIWLLLSSAHLVK